MARFKKMTERIKEQVTFIGASGLVGSVVKDYLVSRPNYAILSPSSGQLDITNELAVERWMDDHPVDVIFNFGAYTNVNDAQKEPDNALKLNVEGIRVLAESAERRDIFIVNIGSNFESSGREPLAEDDMTGSREDVGVYAYTKILGARILKEIGVRHAHIRIANPYGNWENEKDFALRTREMVKAGIAQFEDQWITPTFILDLARVVDIVASDQIEGTFHVASPTVTTPYEFAKAVAILNNIPTTIKSGSFIEYSQKIDTAKRPQHAELLTELTRQRLNIEFTSWYEGLLKMFT
jgi:dTDP-4-dehydrorhamnose reductase